MKREAIAPRKTRAPAALPATSRLDGRVSVRVFLAFAAAYFCSALVRAITATLSPVLTQAFSLRARDLAQPSVGMAFSAMGVFLCCCIASYAYFLRMKADNSSQ